MGKKLIDNLAICHFTVFCLTSMGSIEVFLLVIWLSLLNLGHPL